MSTAIYGMIATAVIVLVGMDRADAYPRYNDGCQLCHGAFTDDTSPLGTVFPGDKHEMHRGAANMDTDCDLCHTNGDNKNPFTGSSNGTANNIGYGCAGCHGRVEDESSTTGMGAGLRQHHFNAGTTTCVLCHSDADPANYTPVDEDVVPPYYGTADTLAAEPCNPDPTARVNENWSIGDFAGLDNDGDHAYDALDVACLPEPGENLLLAAGIGALLVLRHRRTASSAEGFDRSAL